MNLVEENELKCRMFLAKRSSVPVSPLLGADNKGGVSTGSEGAKM